MSSIDLSPHSFTEVIRAKKIENFNIEEITFTPFILNMYQFPNTAVGLYYKGNCSTLLVLSLALLRLPDISINNQLDKDFRLKKAFI